MDHYYPDFIQQIYGHEPGLATGSYLEQRRQIDAQLFGETVFEVSALRELGHEAWDSLVNVLPLQSAWTQEHGHHLERISRLGWRRRRGLVPWPIRTDSSWIGEAVLEQVKFHRPDVVHVQCMDTLDPRLITELRGLVRLVVGQIAAPISMERAQAGYSLIVSSLPSFVARFRAAGLDAEWLPLAFEPSLLETIGPRRREIQLSFVGSISRNHQSRLNLLETIAERMPLSVWTGETGELGQQSPLRRDLRGPAWGVDMYRVLASSRVTLNHHIDIADGYANNLRLYEATGMGALLLTDAGSNLGDLFDVGREVVMYDSVEDCAEKAEHFLAHPAEAATIAAAGQARTLRDHTWRNRMERLVNMIEKRLRPHLGRPSR